MSAFFYDPSLIKQYDVIRISNRGKPVGDYHGSPFFHELPKAFLQNLFGLGVYVGGSFIQEQDGGVRQ